MDHSITITTATLSRIRDFLSPKEQLGREDTFTLPELPLVNVFINLFFHAFLPQAPVLHRPTLDMDDLPSELLAIIMVIGSCYSRLRHTRRFGIIVLDRIRLNLLALIEADNSLMREPHIIYAFALQMSSIIKTRLRYYGRTTRVKRVRQDLPTQMMTELAYLIRLSYGRNLTK
ncbi:unnamed protein product [Alternaria sp. RS040]